jgi:hypothetical protein
MIAAKTVVTPAQIVFKRFKIANFEIVRLPYPHAGIGKDKHVVGQ